MENYIENKKYLYTSILEFLEESDEDNDDEVRKESFQKLINIINSQQVEKDGEEMLQFLEIIKIIGEHHHRDQHFNEGMNQILLYYKDQIKQTFSNTKIFHIFENNKKIVLFLLKNDIITISDEICNEMINKIDYNKIDYNHFFIREQDDISNQYYHFFIPELENYAGEEKMEFVKNELLKEDPNIFTNYEMKREEGENDSYICSLIRQDSVEDFISHVTRQNISPLSEIPASIFETNPFLIDNKRTTLIEYSAFFGSIQIFRYLLMNKAKLTPSLWLYTIHSKNAELFHLLETYEVPPPESENKEYPSQKNYEQCIIESIKCHHNDFADYIENNLLDQMWKGSEEIIISNCIKYHNYLHFQPDLLIDHGFFYLSFHHYDKLFDLLLKVKEQSIEKKLIQYPNNHYLLKMHEISDGLFEKSYIRKLTIPSSVTSIGRNAFYHCISLKQIVIPSSVTSIGEYAFNGCSNLIQITFEIPSSVTSIENSSFLGCSSLKQITIPSSVTSIGGHSFWGCSKLTEITFPSSVTSIGDYAFRECSRLAQITFETPSSLTSIGNQAFWYCYSLREITFPSSITSIGDSAFAQCISLRQITIPSSATEIGDYAFSECNAKILYK